MLFVNQEKALIDHKVIHQKIDEVLTLICSGKRELEDMLTSRRTLHAYYAQLRSSEQELWDRVTKIIA